MKKIILLFVLTAILVNCLAQQQSKISAEILLGPCLPIEKFADKNYAPFNNSSGLAKTGFSITGNFKYLLNNYFGLQFSGGGSFNKQDPQAIADYINHGANYPLNTKIETNTWKVAKILIGIYYQAHFNHSRLIYSFGALTGLCKTAVPAYSWAVYTQSGTLNNGQQHDKMPLPWAFSYQINAGVGYDIKNNIYCMLNANYFNANSTSSSTGLKYNFGSVNIMAGAAIKF